MVFYKILYNKAHLIDLVKVFLHALIYSGIWDSTTGHSLAIALSSKPNMFFKKKSDGQGAVQYRALANICFIIICPLKNRPQR